MSFFKKDTCNLFHVVGSPPLSTTLYEEDGRGHFDYRDNLSSRVIVMSWSYSAAEENLRHKSINLSRARFPAVDITKAEPLRWKGDSEMFE